MTEARARELENPGTKKAGPLGPLCTLIAIHRRIAGAPLVVAANRDEFFARPAEGPALRSGWGRFGPVMAPLDVQAGGTWLGLNAESVFAAVTNLRCGEPDPTRRSRGLLVVDALGEPTAARAADRLKGLPERAYNPFNCYVADSDRAFHLTYRDVPKVRELSPGVHVLGNLEEEPGPVPKLERVREGAERATATDRDGVLDALAAVCREHAEGGLGGTCVHVTRDPRGYGTRSSTLLMLADRREDDRLLWADGAPCTTDYTDRTPLLREQSRRAGYAADANSVRKAS